MIERTLTDKIIHIAKYFPVILLTGPRQVGKTTIFEEISQGKYSYVSLDDLSKRELAQKDPALFIQSYEPPLIIDEIQYAPQLFTYIKIYVDTHNDQNGLFFLTGSQKFHLIKGVQESLAGRVAVLDLLGFSYKEIINKAHTESFLPDETWIKNSQSFLRENSDTALTVHDMYEIIWNGSFPRLVSQNNHGRDVFYRSYIQTYIERDIKDSHNITDSIAFYNFIRAVAARTGQLLNFTDLARDISIDSKTAKSWLAILERSGLVQLLYPYYSNITQRIIKTPKVYFLDTGLCSYLTGWDSPKTLEAGAMSGAILETYVYAEILKSYWHNCKEAPIYFYRDKDQKEIDFILEVNGTIYPIEVKKTLMPNESAVKNFGVLEKLNKPIGQGAVLCLNPDLLPITKKVVSVPIWTI